MNIEKKFKDFIKIQNLEEKKILLMVSGGVDSMVLLYIATKVIGSKNIAIFHLDHGVREDSNDDLMFVQNTCSSKGVKFYFDQLSSSSTGSPPLEGVKNLESQWRKSRQELSQKAAKEFETNTVFTAHHATDLVETMIFRLTKGCGIDGLSPFDKTTKPFWDIPKTEIIKYAQKNKIQWNEDSSNQDTDFQRNLIRQNILPELRKITPNLEKVFVKESIIFEKIQDSLNIEVSKILENKQEINLRQFQSLPTALQREFLRKISKKIPSFSEVEDCLKWLCIAPKGNSQKEIGGTQLTIEKGIIVWCQDKSHLL